MTAKKAVATQGAAQAVELGTENLKIAIIGGLIFGAFAVSLLKDGVSFKDGEALVAKFNEDADFEEKVKAGYQAVELAGAEIKAMTVMKAFGLVPVLAEYGPAFIGAFKKAA